MIQVATKKISIGHIYYHGTDVVKFHWTHLQSCGNGLLDSGYICNDGTCRVKHHHCDGDCDCPDGSIR